MTILERLRNAGQALIGREQRFAEHDFLAFSRGVGQSHPFKPKESIRAYGDNPWLHSAVDVIAAEVSRTDFFLEEKKGDAWERVESHEALDTLKTPVPMRAGKSHLTSHQLFSLVAQHKLLNGEAFWLLEERRKVNRAPTKIEPLMPGDVQLHFDGNLISHYTYGTNRTRLEAEDVVHFKVVNPESWSRGHAPTKSIRFALDTQFEADLMNLQHIKNNAVPSGILTSEQKVADDERKKLLAHWKSMYGGAKNSGKTAMLPHGFKFSRIQDSNAEMEYSQQKEWNRDEILANYRVGLEMLGRTESQTRANADAAIYVFSRFVVLPMVEMIVDTLNNDYLTQFPGSEGLRFNFPDPVPENVEEKRSNVKALMEAAALTPDEARQQMGLEPLNVPGVTDITYIPFNLVPATAPPGNLAA